MPWPKQGRLQLFGLPDYLPIQLSPILEKPGTLQSVGLSAQMLPFPDEPGLHDELPLPPSPRVLVALLAHQSAQKIQEYLDFWLNAGLPADDLLLLHGGKIEDFNALDFSRKVFLADASLRVIHQREENQSHFSVVEAIAQNLGQHTHVFYTEYDLQPLVPAARLFARALEDMTHESAEVLFPTLYRVDSTCQEVYLQQVARPEFSAHWKDCSVRAEKQRVCWALLPGSFWRERAIRAAAAHPEPFPIYCEIYLPTMLYHLGYRIRPWVNCPMKILGGGNLRAELPSLRAAGQFAAHPVK